MVTRIVSFAYCLECSRFILDGSFNKFKLELEKHSIDIGTFQEVKRKVER
jgi:hypothetical protein